MTEMALQRRLYQRTIPIFIASVIVGLCIVNYYTDEAIKVVISPLQTWSSSISSILPLYGLVTLVIMRYRNVVSDQPFREKITSICFWVAFVVVSVCAVVLPGGTSNPDFTTNYALVIGVSSNCIVALRYAGHLNAAYRGIPRVRTIESLALAISWALSLLGTSSLAVYYAPFFGDAADWIRTYPHVAASRACTIALATGTALMAIRALFMREPGIMESERE